MKIEYIVGNPLDYSEGKFNVYFEVASKENALKVILRTGITNEVVEKEYGFVIQIARQQIPEIVREFAEQNIAIYAVVPGKRV